MKMHIYAIINQKGGVGKSTTAAAAAGVSVNEYAIQAINEKIGREN
jgi:MinD-like ATPase involved in chromosome partitioning or flagellar assembly